MTSCPDPHGASAAGSLGGRAAVESALAELELDVSTTELPHVINGLLSIDDVAVPRGSRAVATRIEASYDRKRLSDHDAYIVEVDLS